jgi:CheY-like chemotaxis protein
VNLTKDLLHQILDPKLSANERAHLRCELAKQLEQARNFEAAREAMGELWRGVGERPNLESLDQRTASEVLLRSGALTGYIGSTKQVAGSQEKAKDLISESMAIFESLGDAKKVAEAKTEIAVCYAREGQLDNARVMLSEAVSQLNEEDEDLNRRALLRSAIVEKLADRVSDALNMLTKAAPLFEASNNHTLVGSFHNEFGNVLRRFSEIENATDYIDRAVIEYTAASVHFELGGNTRYQACVENNLALLYLKTDRFAEAHEHLDRAQALFTRLNDPVHLAQVEDTRARVMLAEGAIAKAEKVARSAVRMLEKGDEPSLLTEALITHGITLIRLNQKEQAQATFEDAIAVSERAGDLESAGLATIRLVEEIGQELSDDELYVTLERARQLLKDNTNPASRDRLLECAFYGLSLLHTYSPEWTNYSLDKSVHRYEARQIRRALQDAGGVISQAARLLGLTHQRLHKILKNRHKDLRHVLAEIIASGQESNPAADPISDRHQETSKTTLPITVLHVEDDPTIAGLIQEISEHEGWELEYCADGTIALKELASDTDYDVLLVDFELPGVNGLELVRQARSMVHRQDLRIIMLSGRMNETEAREAGADTFLRKPQDIGAIVETINRLVGEHEQER